MCNTQRLVLSNRSMFAISEVLEARMVSLDPDFVRRSNPNGTTDSICKSCFLTVATAMWEADLDSAERQHTCDPFRLSSLKKSVQRATGGTTESDKLRGPVRVKRPFAC